MTTTTEKAKAISLDELRALAKQYPTVKVDVAFRVNPTGYNIWGDSGERRDFWEERPTPTVYYLSSNSGYDPESKRFRQAYPKNIVYLAPVVGKLLRDAEYLGHSTRARSLARTVQDLEYEVKKHLPEQLAEIDAVEAARMEKLAIDDARKQIREAALTLVNRLDRLGQVAGLEAYAFDARNRALELGAYLNNPVKEVEGDADASPDLTDDVVQ